VRDGRRHLPVRQRKSSDCDERDPKVNRQLRATSGKISKLINYNNLDPNRLVKYSFRQFFLCCLSTHLKSSIEYELNPILIEKSINQLLSVNRL